MKILTMDDEVEILNYLKEILEDEGHSVVTAESVKSGLDAQLAEEFDLVIMDLQMPQINGREVIDLMRMKRPKLPIIVLSGHIDSKDELRQLGATEVLPKPIEMRILLETIKRIKDN